ncbi:hypothetical protein PCC6912_45750 [Chlorogloeopsis fritschii PCC 6912]|uniref:Uncharacterized protein n=1 Tax=Chlorogloeopsis fritschii PCC 6912 TaxID=211165 RepID=A0A3S0ZH07_CHLFR|nr:hypothetical protein PCC6912_45750 [Chlorogloeopsis fritschii PCC 6912]
MLPGQEIDLVGLEFLIRSFLEFFIFADSTYNIKISIFINKKPVKLKIALLILVKARVIT